MIFAIQRVFLILLLVFLTSSCTGLGLGLDDKVVREAYEDGKLRIEADAHSGRTTWVQAAQRVRDLDKNIGNARGLDTTWKYTTDDDEYHTYCIAIAEQLDQRRISFAQFDALRARKLNDIQVRLRVLANQRRAAMNGGQVQPAAAESSISTGSGTDLGATCFKQREWVSGLNRNCVYSCMGSQAVQTIGAAEICPLSIKH